MKTRSFIPIVIAALISIIAVMLLITAVMYQSKKNEQTNTNAISQSTNKIACAELRDETSCQARIDCVAVKKCSKWPDSVNGASTACAEYAFDYCAPTGCDVGSGIKNFSECEQAGCPVQESYPRKCLAGGMIFDETLTNAITNSAMNGNTNTTVDTTGWKTFKNVKLGFSLKLPPTWDNYIVEGQTDISVKITHPKKISNKGNPGEVSFVITRLSGVAVKPPDSISVFYGQFAYSPSNKAKPDEMADLWNQIDDIIATLNFLDNSEDWVTYNSASLGLSFQYPPSCLVTPVGSEKITIHDCLPPPIPDMEIKTNDITVEQFTKEFIAGDPSFNTITQTSFVVGGVAGVKLVGGCQCEDSQNAIFVTHQGRQFLITYQGERSWQNKIFSTITFTK